MRYPVLLDVVSIPDPTPIDKISGFVVIGIIVFIFILTCVYCVRQVRLSGHHVENEVISDDSIEDVPNEDEEDVSNEDEEDEDDDIID